MIINSVLDNDLYKFTMQQAVLKYKQDVPVQYGFINRRPEGRFTREFEDALGMELYAMGGLRTTSEEVRFLRDNCPYLGEEYLQFLKNFIFNPMDVSFSVRGGDLNLQIKGTWENTILWEVPLMAMISELYFTYCDKDWDHESSKTIDKATQKGIDLRKCNYAEFGTRRRRSYRTQDWVNQFMGNKGTSNVHFAMKYGKKPIGTMAHEWIMGISALEGLRHANRYALQIWNEVYKGNLGIALTDTFGTDAFFGDFDGVLARLFDGLRWDSGPWDEFARKAVNHYKSLSIKTITKSLVFTDNLDVVKALEIQKALEEQVQVSFGIGTHLTNDFVCRSDNSVVSKALNMVIKLMRCNEIPVVKLGDGVGKQMGDKDALRVANWTFKGTPLDA